MKKLIYGTLFLALVGILIVGCEKENFLAISSNDNVNEQNVQKISQTVSFMPSSYSNISELFGNEHNAVLNYVLIENPTQNQNDLFNKFKLFYNNSSMNVYFNNDLSSEILPELNIYFFNKAKFIEKLNKINNDFSNLSSVSLNEKQKFNCVISHSITFINNGIVEDFVNALNILKNECVSEKCDVLLTSPNQEYVKVLSVIGVTLNSVEFCKSRSLITGNINIPPMSEGPAGIAPWVLADLGGAAIGAITNAGNYAVSGGSHSWSGFAFDVVSGGLIASGGGWISKWLW